MPKIEDLFKPHTAKSAGFAKHRKGNVAYVTNGFRNNGIVGFVEALPDEKTYTFLGIVLSTFCEATVQIPPFIARGNGGSGLMVLEPIKRMTADQLGYMAAYINTDLRWRYNWYRQATVEKIRRLEVPDPSTSGIKFPVRSFLPTSTEAPKPSAIRRMTLKAFPLDTIFEMAPGDYHNAGELGEGETPLVSCGDRNNGIVAFVEVPPQHIYHHKMTISFNGMNTLATKFHPYPFATKDDVAVCTPRNPALRISTLFLIQVMLGQEKWRYNFYRKCFMDKLRRQTVNLPSVRGEIDENAIEELVKTSPYWLYVKKRYDPKVSDQSSLAPSA